MGENDLSNGDSDNRKRKTKCQEAERIRMLNS